MRTPQTKAQQRAYYLKHRPKILARANARYRPVLKNKRSPFRYLTDRDIMGMGERPHPYGTFTYLAGGYAPPRHTVNRIGDQL